jgi:hypothetical protein
VDDLREQGVGAAFSARITNPPVWFSVPAVTLDPTALATGMGSPVSIDVIDVAPAAGELAVDGYLLTRTDAQQVADLDGIDLHHHVAAVRLPVVSTFTWSEGQELGQTLLSGSERSGRNQMPRARSGAHRQIAASSMACVCAAAPPLARSKVTTALLTLPRFAAAPS